MLGCTAIATLLAGPVPANSIQDPIVYPDLGLTLTLPAADLRVLKEKLKGPRRGDWLGEWKGLSLRVRFDVHPNTDGANFEPEDVVEGWRQTYSEPAQPGEVDEGFTHTFDAVRSLAAPVGCSPILAILRSKIERKDDPGREGMFLIAGGLLPESSWSLRVTVWPGPDEAGATELVNHFEGCMRYDGKLRDPAWTDAEALAFWKAWAPESTHKKFEKPIRTKQLIFLTNSTSPGLYVKLIEKRFASIAKTLPVDELKGRKLLPVLLFRTNDDFEAFYRKLEGLGPSDDVDDNGTVEGFVYVTSCDRGNEYYHSLDLAELYLKNRRRAWSGGHWFTAGLSEYVSNTPKDRLDGLRAVKKGKHTSLAKLLDDESWGGQHAKLERKGASEEASYWEQSGMWMEFLREGPWPKDAFPRFVDAVGTVPYGEGEAVAQAIQAIYGMDLASLEQRWVQHFSKR